MLLELPAMDNLSVSVRLIFTCTALVAYFVTGSSQTGNQQQPFAVPSLPQIPPTLQPTGIFSNGRRPTQGLCPTPIPIVNRSLPCDTKTYQRIALSDDMLKQVLNDEGGNYVTAYMAASDDEAEMNFKNLVHINDLYEDTDFVAHPSDWSWDYSLTKKTLLDELDKAYKQYYGTTTLKHDPQKAETLSPQGLYRELLENSLGSNEDDRTTHTTDLNSVLQNQGTWKDVKTKIPLRALHRIVPAKYHYPDFRRRRSTSGAKTVMEYCRNPGAMTADGYFYLCSTCAHTTTLGDRYFPRIINEVWCNTDSKGCMYLDHVAHGSCRQSVFYMTMLRKMNSCMTVIKDGVYYITNEWEKYAQPIKLGCECVLDKRSPFAKYVKP